MPRQHLTPNACLVCRKKRTKCDGQIPCRRCRSRGEECAYEDKKWRTKDHLRSEIERLRSEQRQGLAVIRALTNNDPKTWEAVLDRMRDEEPPDSIAQWVHTTNGHLNQGQQLPFTSGPSGLRGSPPSLPSPSSLQSASIKHPATPQCGIQTPSFSNPSYQSPAPGLNMGGGHGPRPTDLARLPRHSFSAGTSFGVGSRDAGVPPYCAALSHATSIMAYPRRSCPDIRLTFPGADMSSRPSWTSVSTDGQLIERLMTKVFASPSSSSMHLISQPHCARDFYEGGQRYCSGALVNALLGWASQLVDAPVQLISQLSFGDAFVGEARRLLGLETSHASLASIQALGVLALVEISQGNAEEAWNLVQESVRSSIHLALQASVPDGDDDATKNVRAMAYCGGFTLMRLLRLLTGRLEPNTGPLFMRLQPNSGEFGEDAPGARIERGIALQMRFFNELTFCLPVARFVFEVTETVHTFSSYNYSRAMTAEDLEDAYRKCIGYYSRFTETYGSDTGSTPDLLFAQIWYNCCLLMLLRPFVCSLESLGGNSTSRLRLDATPGFICRESSEAVISLTSTYQARFSLRNPPPLLPHMVFTAVLYQLSLTADLHRLDEYCVGTPVKQSPEASGLSYQQEGPFRSIPFSTPTSVRPVPHPQSPNLCMQARRAARRHSSALSKISPCPSSAEHKRRPSISAFNFAMDTDGDEMSSDTTSEVLPTFTSDPADLITIGTLQLVSMGAQHCGAAVSTQLLQHLGDVHDLRGVGIDPVLSGLQSLPVDEFTTAMLTAGFGFQENQPPAMPNEVCESSWEP
ncbi:hypothetical protein OQA88_11497 [Cercophora sp. LCS_1]